jgi:hypothetical protein
VWWVSATVVFLFKGSALVCLRNEREFQDYEQIQRQVYCCDRNGTYAELACEEHWMVWQRGENDAVFHEMKTSSGVVFLVVCEADGPPSYALQNLEISSGVLCEEFCCCFPCFRFMHGSRDLDFCIVLLRTKVKVPGSCGVFCQNFEQSRQWYVIKFKMKTDFTAMVFESASKRENCGMCVSWMRCIVIEPLVKRGSTHSLSIAGLGSRPLDDYEFSIFSTTTRSESDLESKDFLLSLCLSRTRVIFLVYAYLFY